MLEQAREFHKQHPEVWLLFEKFTFDLISRGFRHYSAKGVFERIRWETDQADVNGESTFKVNNNYSPFYARAFMQKHPQHDGFYRLRRQTSKDEKATGLPELSPQDFDQEQAA
jgi:hypothetical protein